MILIYQFGKVASNALMKGLNGVYLNRKKDKYKHHCIHTHEAEVAKDIIKKSSNIKIICPIRFPLQRNMSAFFHNIKKFSYFKKMTPKQICKLDMEILHERFREKYVAPLEPNRWLREATPILTEEFFTPFNFNIKHKTIKHPQYEILVLRYEDIKYWSPIIRSFLNQDFKLKQTNTTKEKWQGKIYAEFKKTFELTKEEKYNMSQMPYVINYYSQSEINGYCNKIRNIPFI
jgi:hypothetical protein